MTKRKARLRNDERTRARAIRELGINVPIYRTRVVGNRLELFVYPGIALYWPPEPGDEEPDDIGAQHAAPEEDAGECKPQV